MSEEPRRSGRATKGQHKNAASSPAPPSKPVKAAAAKTKPVKKSAEPEVQTGDDDDEVIRCVCGNTNPKDRRAFIGCDSCTVWQHNVCMGLPDDEDDVPDHYFCEECRPEEHRETLQALEKGENIWEARNKIHQVEKKLSKRGKNKGKPNEETKPGWLKKELITESSAPLDNPESASASKSPTNGASDAGSKRKREESKSELEETEATIATKNTRVARQDKRRKSSVIVDDAVLDPETALLEIEELPVDRRKIAQVLSKIIAEDVQERLKAGFKAADGETAASLGDHHASRIEYALHMVYGGPKEQSYGAQFRALNANLKKNKSLVERLLSGDLTADALSRMSTSEMASEELQRERAVMKEALDRQAVAIPEQGPRYKQDHKGYRLIEDEADAIQAGANQEAQHALGQKMMTSQVANTAFDSAGHDTAHQSPGTPNVPQSAEFDEQRQSSATQFDMHNIWAKTPRSPTAVGHGTAVRTTDEPAHRRTSSHGVQVPLNGAKEDPDVDRMLADHDETLASTELTGPDAVVWRGKLVQSNDDNAPTMNARHVAGRDIAPTVAWRDLLPATLSIDGRLQIQKAEDYLCGLRWSNSSDVCVLALTPYDNAEAFNTVFDYFHSRQRYAVIEKDKPKMIKDLYIIPLDVGSKLPSHLEMLEHCTIKQPVEERVLLATIIVARAPETPPVNVDAAANGHGSSNANGIALQQRPRQSVGGPAGSPMTAQTPIFNAPHASQTAKYGSPSPFPPNPYGGPLSQPPAAYASPAASQVHSSPQVNEVLGELQFAPTAQQILRAAQTALTVEQLRNLKSILTDDPSTRTDIDALARKLSSEG